MSINHKKIILNVMVVLCLILVLDSYVNARLFANQSGDAFADASEEKSVIESDIVEGASYFLRSYSDILLFLNEVEISEPEAADYNRMRSIISQAVENMDRAKATYTNLNNNAAAASYDQNVIDQLMLFDYDGFQWENNVNEVVFSEVKDILSQGDVRGIYSQLLSRLDVILNMLNTVKSMVDADTFPGLPDLWNLNQQTAETFLLGQYTAEVFYEIADK